MNDKNYYKNPRCFNHIGRLELLQFRLFRKVRGGPPHSNESRVLGPLTSLGQIVVRCGEDFHTPLEDFV